MNVRALTKITAAVALALAAGPLALAADGGSPTQLSPKPGSGAAPSTGVPSTATTPATPPPFTVVSWNEDYSYLRDASKRSDPFDAIKYVPLSQSGDVYVSFGGQFRERYERFDSTNFGAGPQDDNGYFLHRLFAHADLHVGPYFRAFVEGISAMIDDRNGGARPTDSDQLDLAQAFLDLNLPLGDAGTVTFRGGRQDLIYGAQRLISPLDWVNTRRTFEGGKVSWVIGNNTLDAFIVRPVIIDDHIIDPDDAHSNFAGVYDTLKLPGLIPNAGSQLEGYFLSLNKTARGPIAMSPAVAAGSDTYTIGARFYTNPKPWDLDVEADYQFGRAGAHGDISAWSIAVEGGYRFACPTAPRLYVGFDAASGDRDPANPDKQTFNQLFPLGHAYFGYIDVIGRQNIVDIHPGLELELLKNKQYVQRMTLRSDYHFFWRESTADAVYNAAGGVLRAGPGNNDSYIGSELDLLLNWQINRHLATYVGYSRFFSGSFINHTGPSQDINFCYAAVQFTF